MDEVEEAMLALEDAAGKLSGWVVSGDPEFFIWTDGQGWIPWKRRMEAPRRSLDNYFSELGETVLRRTAELRDYPRPMSHYAKWERMAGGNG